MVPDAARAEDAAADVATAKTAAVATAQNHQFPPCHQRYSPPPPRSGSNVLRRSNLHRVKSHQYQPLRRVRRPSLRSSSNRSLAWALRPRHRAFRLPAFQPRLRRRHQSIAYRTVPRTRHRLAQQRAGNKRTSHQSKRSPTALQTAARARIWKPSSVNLLWTTFRVYLRQRRRMGDLRFRRARLRRCSALKRPLSWR